MFLDGKIKNILFNASYYLLNVLFPLLTFPYVSRVLGVEGMGSANLVISTATYFSTLASLGIPIYGIREVAKSKDDKKKLNYVVSELLCLNFIGVVVCFILYVIVIQSIPIMKNNSYLYIIASINIILSFFQVDWLFQGLEKFKILAVRSFITKVLAIFLVYSLVTDSGDTSIYIITNVIALSLGNIFNLVTMLKLVKLEYLNLNISKHIKPIIYFSATRLMSTVYTLLDSVILGILTSNYYVGLYSIAIRMIRVITTLISSVTTVFFAETSRLADNDKEKYNGICNSLFSFLMLITIPTVIYTNIFAKELLELFAGQEFNEGVYTLKILSILIFISIVTNFIGVQILYSKGKEKNVLISLAIGAAVCIISNLLLVPTYHQNGSAVSAVLSELSILLVQIIFVIINKFSFDFIFNKNIIKLLTINVFFLLFTSIQYIGLNNEYSALVVIIISSISSIMVYGVLSYLFKEETMRVVLYRK